MLITVPLLFVVIFAVMYLADMLLAFTVRTIAGEDNWYTDMFSSGYFTLLYFVVYMMFCIIGYRWLEQQDFFNYALRILFGGN